MSGSVPGNMKGVLVIFVFVLSSSVDYKDQPVLENTQRQENVVYPCKDEICKRVPSTSIANKISMSVFRRSGKRAHP